MAIRVALIGPGNCGSLALRQLVEDKRFDLTGVWVSSDAKIGRDAGELAGLSITTGVTAVNDLDAIVAAKPDCAVYCAMGDVRLPEAMADIRTILAAGINVVGSAPGVLQYPWQVIPDKYIERVEDAASVGNSSVFITGVDPGFATDLLPFALAGTCQSIEQIRTMEIADYATYDGETVMFDVMGFGNPIGEFPMLFQPGVLSIAWGTAIRQLAAGLGVEVDEIRDSVEQEPAPEDLDVAAGHIAKGTVAALRFQIEGMVKGKPVIVVEHVTSPARRPASGLGAAGPPRRLVPDRDHRRTVLLRRHRPHQSQRRRALCGHPRRRGSNRELHSRRGEGCAGHPHHAGHAAGHRQGRLLDSVSQRRYRSPARPMLVHSNFTCVPRSDRLDRRPVGERLHQRDAAAPASDPGLLGRPPRASIRHHDGDRGCDGVVPGLQIHGARAGSLQVGELGAVGHGFVDGEDEITRAGRIQIEERAQPGGELVASSGRGTRIRHDADALEALGVLDGRGIHCIDHDSCCLPGRCAM